MACGVFTIFTSAWKNMQKLCLANRTVLIMGWSCDHMASVEAPWTPSSLFHRRDLAKSAPKVSLLIFQRNLLTHKSSLKILQVVNMINKCSVILSYMAPAQCQRSPPLSLSVSLTFLYFANAGWQLCFFKCWDGQQVFPKCELRPAQTARGTLVQLVCFFRSLFCTTKPKSHSSHSWHSSHWTPQSFFSVVSVTRALSEGSFPSRFIHDLINWYQPFQSISVAKWCQRLTPLPPDKAASLIKSKCLCWMLTCPNSQLGKPKRAWERRDCSECVRETSRGQGLDPLHYSPALTSALPFGQDLLASLNSVQSAAKTDFLQEQIWNDNTRVIQNGNDLC